MLEFLALASVVVSFFIWKNNKTKEEDRKRNEQENRERLYRKAKELESQFYEVGSIEKQYDCLKDLASTASSLDYIYGHDTWLKIEAACRLLKRNCAAGEHDRYWIRADELHKAAQAEIRKY